MVKWEECVVRWEGFLVPWVEFVALWVEFAVLWVNLLVVCGKVGGICDDIGSCVDAVNVCDYVEECVYMEKFVVIWRSLWLCGGVCGYIEEFVVIWMSLWLCGKSIKRQQKKSCRKEPQLVTWARRACVVAWRQTGSGRPRG